MVIGMVPTSSSAETLLNNLAEADFKSAEISVIMQDQKTRDAIAKDAGPFKGVGVQQLPARLAKAGVPAKDAQSYVDAMARGQVFVAINTPKASAAAASEMLKDVSAQMIKELP
jgi:hypothetical protein